MMPSLWAYVGVAARTVFTAIMFHSSAEADDPTSERCALVEAPDALAASAAKVSKTHAASNPLAPSAARFLGVFIPMTPRGRFGSAASAAMEYVRTASPRGAIESIRHSAYAGRPCVLWLSAM
jgi:hypothetical protein